MMDRKPVYLIYIGIFLNLILFFIAYYLKLPLLPYHTGTLYVCALLGMGGGILVAIVTFLTVSLFAYGMDFIWFILSGALIAVIAGDQFKKGTRPVRWLIAAGEVFLCEWFFYILFTLWHNNSIPYDYCGQRIFMFFYEQNMEEIFAVCIAGAAIALLSSIQATVTAALALVCTPKRFVLPNENPPSKQKRLQAEQNQE